MDAHDGQPVSGPTAWSRARDALRDAAPDASLSGRSADLQRVCRAASASLSLAGAVVHVVNRSGEGVVVAGSDEATRRIGEVAFALGEAPCLSAFELARPVLVPDLLGEGQFRWPGYVSAIRGEGVRASYSFPLHVGGVRLGVLDLYGAQVGTLSPDLMSLAFVFAEVATEHLLDAPPGSSPSLLNGHSFGALEHRAEIHQAQGMVTVDLGVDLAAALALMRAHAFSSDLPLLEIARGILAGERLPTPEEE